ncbi:calcium-binding protein, partial [Geminocystis sp. GBBB08]|uniref:calcium-binding protein n=1 Tax=Geminocystis sp. GBBB08 TaxID=2604140 RepID=UPI0027E2C279
LQGTAINGTGNESNNTINGNGSDNVLIGGDGNDILNGGTGNDTFFGGDGNDILNGGAGNDSLMGGLGNDIYYVDSGNDQIIELQGEGTDTVNSTIDYSLIANVENLTLQGTAINGTGNESNNTINGNGSDNVLIGGDGNDNVNGGTGNDTLIGGVGKDILTGGIGSDGFGYQTLTDSLLANYDIIKDFNANEDKFFVTTTPTVFTQGGNVTALTPTAIAAKLTTTNLINNEYVAQFTFGSRTFIAINDHIAGFQSGNDAIIELTTSGLTGTLALGNFVVIS